MRKILVSVLFAIVVLSSTAAQASIGSPSFCNVGSGTLTANTDYLCAPSQNDRDAFLESGGHSRQFNAVIFRTDSVTPQRPARAQIPSGDVETPNDSVSSETLERFKSAIPSQASRQTVTRQNIVERK